MRDLGNRVALVTGASRGIGRVIAQTLGAAGMRLALVARSAAPLSELAKTLSEAGRPAFAYPVDVTDRSALASLVAQVESDLGSIDVLVNNAGIEVVCPFDELPLAEMDQILATNLVSVMTLTRLCLPGMLARSRGHIVNLASLAGKAGPPLPETYAASKAGLIGFTQSLRVSYEGSGVSASAICPGFVSDAGMFADRARAEGVRAPRLLGSSTPEAVARAVLRSIRDDVPEILVNPGPARLTAALGQLFPRLPAWLVRRLGLREMYRKSASSKT